jgi:hypothetical protein
MAIKAMLTVVTKIQIIAIHKKTEGTVPHHRSPK